MWRYTHFYPPNSVLGRNTKIGCSPHTVANNNHKFALLRTKRVFFWHANQYRGRNGENVAKMCTLKLLLKHWMVVKYSQATITTSDSVDPNFISNTKRLNLSMDKRNKSIDFVDSLVEKTKQALKLKSFGVNFTAALLFELTKTVPEFQP